MYRPNIDKGGQGKSSRISPFTFVKSQQSDSTFTRPVQPAAFSGGYSNTFHGYESYAGQRRKPKTEEEYFEGASEYEDQGYDALRESNNEDNLEYQPAPDSPSHNKEDDEDPLDAFMSGIQEKVEEEKKELEARVEFENVSKKAEKKRVGQRTDLDEEDVQESYFRYMEENPDAGLNTIALLDDDGIDIDYDADGNPIVPEKNKVIDPLPPIDHSKIQYKPFEKNFYIEHKDITELTPAELNDHRTTLNIKVSGANSPRPGFSFAHFGFDEQLMNAIRKSEFTRPTPIQSQAVPAAMSGRDVVGIAKTGSGKTVAYLWPLLIHIMDQTEISRGDGPIGLIVAPTRELSLQIYGECRKFGKVYNLKVVCAYGGGNMYEQTKACEEGCEIIVATPGRLIDLIKRNATNLQRVTYLVFDEADRMFDMGFEAQVRSIASHVRSDRQTLLFSATFKRRIERLCRDVLTDPIKIVQGELGEANQDITQHVLVFSGEDQGRWRWLSSKLAELQSHGQVLIFVTKKVSCEELAESLKANDFIVGVIHGDMSQVERNEVITSFRKGLIKTLVATDVAARGLDIPAIKNVINYDLARDIDTHTHRIGRTGRAGEKGTAYTLVTDKDKELAGHLVRNLESANQIVTDALMKLAMQSQWFGSSRFKQGKGKKIGIGGKGLGFKARPCFGSAPKIPDTVSVEANSSNHSQQQTYTHLGPGTDRLSAVKSAFKSQYMRNFHVASSTDTGKLDPTTITSTQTSRRKKTRWE